MEFLMQMVAIGTSLIVSLIGLQTALINRQTAKMKAEEERINAEKRKAAPVDAGSDH